VEADSLRAELSTAIGGRDAEASGGRGGVRRIVREAGGEAMGGALLVK